MLVNYWEQVSQIISTVLEVVLPNLLIILLSSFLGAAFLLKGQTIQKRRNRLAAFYSETLNNTSEVANIRDSPEEYIDAHYAINVQSNALESLQEDTPQLYSNVFFYSDSFPRVLWDIEILSEFRKGAFWKRMIDALEFQSGPAPDGGTQQEEIGQHDLEATQENFEALLDDIVDYVKENKLRSLYYRNCLKGEFLGKKEETS